MTEEKREYCRAWEEKNKFTFKRVSNGIYSMQKNSSKQRGHQPPAYTLEELRSWMQQQPNLNKLLKDYEASGGDRKLAPSVDRLDDEVGYTFDNIRLVTCKVNQDKEHAKQRKAVIQMTLEGEFVKEWSSVHEAAKKTGNHQSNISYVCMGKRPTAGGYKWKFAK